MPRGDGRPFGIRTEYAIGVAVFLFFGQSALLFVLRNNAALAVPFWQISTALNGLLSVLVVLRRLGQSIHLKAHWTSVAAMFVFEILGDGFDSISQLLGHHASSLQISSGRDLLHLVAYIPLFLLVSLPSGRRYFQGFVWLDLAQSLLGTICFYALLFHAIPFAKMPDEGAGAAFFVRMFEIANACGVACLLLHYLAAIDPDEKRFYLFTTIMMATTIATTTLNNEVSLRFPNEIVTNILLYLASLGGLFWFLYLLRDEEPKAGLQRATGMFADVINIGSPVVSSAALLALGLAVQSIQRELGLTAIVAAFLVFATRSTVYLRSFERAQLLLESASERLEELSYTDELTGVANRRAFDQALRAEWQRGSRSGSPLSLILIDIDYFKQLNDSAGHQAGDACLSKIARALRAALPRSIDVLGRYGGDEFAAILPSTDGPSAENVATRLCDMVEALAIPNPATATGYATISLGIGTSTLFEEDATRLLGLADIALYRAKAAGRNRWRSLSLTDLAMA